MYIFSRQLSSHLPLYRTLPISVPCIYATALSYANRQLKRIKDAKTNFVGDHYMAFYQTLRNLLTLSMTEPFIFKARFSRRPWWRLCEQRRILKYGAFERRTLRRVPRQILSEKQDTPETEGAAHGFDKAVWLR